MRYVKKGLRIFVLFAVACATLADVYAQSRPASAVPAPAKEKPANEKPAKAAPAAADRQPQAAVSADVTAAVVKPTVARPSTLTTSIHVELLPHDTETAIPGLKWGLKTIPVEIGANKDQGTVTVRGFYSTPEWNLVVDSQVVEMKGSAFEVKVPILLKRKEVAPDPVPAPSPSPSAANSPSGANSKDANAKDASLKDTSLKEATAAKEPTAVLYEDTSVEVPIRAVGPFGEIISSKLTLKVIINTKKIPFKRHHFVPSLAFSLVSYDETYVDLGDEFEALQNHSISETLVTLKLSYTYAHDLRWSAGISGYASLLGITSNLSGTTAKFYGLNLRAGYSPAFVRGPWRLLVATGLYYTTMSTTGDAFGFKNLMGPQLYPVIERTLPKGDKITAYLKYSPIASQFGLLNLQYGEAAIGGIWTRPMEKNRTMYFSLDISMLSLAIDPATIKTTSFSLGFGYTFW